MAEIEDALRELYAAPPADFTARRTDLVNAAKKRGDTAGAKQIGAARKPTTAAWVVNRLVHDDPGVADRIADVGARLRAAHAAMDGEQIRALSTEQRRLVAELTRTAVGGSVVANPSAALRDDVTDTLHAAVADPEVTARLGRLERAEKWSGFGGFGDIADAVGPPAPKKAKATPKTDDAAEKAEKQKAERDRRERARALIAAAEKAKAEADEVTAQRQSDLATARLRHDDARNRLAAAEEALHAAESAYEDAKKAGRDAADVVKAARRRDE